MQRRSAFLPGEISPCGCKPDGLCRSEKSAEVVVVPVARLRAIQLKHWKRPATMYRELKALGAGETVARRVAGNNRR